MTTTIRQRPVVARPARPRGRDVGRCARDSGRYPPRRGYRPGRAARPVTRQTCARNRPGGRYRAAGPLPPRAGWGR